jgi:hypothetical protein
LWTHTAGRSSSLGGGALRIVTVTLVEALSASASVTVSDTRPVFAPLENVTRVPNAVGWLTLPEADQL